MKIKTVKISSLKQHPKNCNQHPKEQLQELQNSLDQFDQVKNIVAWQGQVIAGCGLLEAAKAQGREEIEIQDVSDWPEKKALSYMIADNRLAELAVMDDDLLADLLKDFDDPLDIPGIDEEYIDSLDIIEMQDIDADDIEKRNLGEKRLQIKPVMYLDEISIFEKAIISADEINRGDALIKICKFWIDNHEEKR